MEVLVTTVQHTRAWLNQHPDFNRTFLPYLGKQMHALADQVAGLSLYDTEARLARLILRYLAPGNLSNDIRLINDLSQETLASMIGSVRVVVGAGSPGAAGESGTATAGSNTIILPYRLVILQDRPPQRAAKFCHADN